MAAASLPFEARREEGGGGKAKPCPICGKAPVAEVAPFCSKRCADIDLHKWLGGRYAVPVQDDDENDPVDHDRSASSADD